MDPSIIEKIRAAAYSNSIFEVILAIFCMIIGITILIKNVSTIKFIRFVSTFWFLYYFIVLLGIVIKYYIDDVSYYINDWKINLSALLISLLFALFALCSDTLGNMLIGSLSGYLVWAMFSVFITKELINLIIIIILTSITEVLVAYYKERGLIIACVWIGSYLSIHSIQLIVLSSIALAEKYDILDKVSLPVYIVTIILKLGVFAFFVYREGRLCEKEEESVKLKHYPV